MCVKIDGIVVDGDMEDTPCGNSLMTKEDHRVLLVTHPPPRLVEALLEVAREEEEISHLNYMNKPPRKMTKGLIRIYTAASDVETQPLDADSSRRCANAFESICGGEGSGETTASSAQVRAALLHNTYVRSLLFPEKSPHLSNLGNALSRMSVRGDVKDVDQHAFSSFFAALCAAACAPESAQQEDPDPQPVGQKKKAQQGGTEGFLSQLLEDPSVSARRIR